MVDKSKKFCDNKLKICIKTNIIRLLIVSALLGCVPNAEEAENNTIQYHQTNIPASIVSLSLREIMAEGWIKRQMERDFEIGFTGYLDSLTHFADIKIFGDQRILGYKTDEEGNKAFIRQSWWAAETTAVWLDGLIRNAYLTGNKTAIHKVRSYIDYVMDHQTEAGYIGIYLPEVRFNHTLENAELWAQTCIFRVMLAYYEFTGNQEVLDAVIRAVNLTMQHYGQGYSYFHVKEQLGGLSHGLMFVDICEWLFRLTGNKKYVPFAEFLYSDYSKHFDNKRLGDTRLDYLLNPDKPYVGHTPHVAEHLRVPAWLYHATGKEIYRKAYQTGYEKLEDYMVPGGAVHSGKNEDIEGQTPTPDMPYEYCGITELLDTQTSLMAKTGNTRYADMAEKLVMNAAQGARFANGKAVCYFSRDNRIKATNEGSGGRFKYSPTHEDVAVCCNPNASKLMPYYVKNMWAKTTGEDGKEHMVALLYGPSRIQTTLNGINVQIHQKTKFPFTEEIKFKMLPGQSSEFSLWLRKPDWSTNLDIALKGAEITGHQDYVIITKKWQPGDTFNVKFSSEIEILKAVNGELVLKKGPLIYALPVDEKKNPIKTYAPYGFADYNITALSDTLWSLHLNKNKASVSFGFKFHEETSQDVRYPWENAPVYLKGKLYSENQTEKEVHLVPMGSTVLRRVTFPVK